MAAERVRYLIGFSPEGVLALEELQRRDRARGGRGTRPDVINQILVWALRASEASTEDNNETSD